jgi:hypothetical protein
MAAKLDVFRASAEGAPLLADPDKTVDVFSLGKLTPRVLIDSTGKIVSFAVQAGNGLAIRSTGVQEDLEFCLGAFVLAVLDHAAEIRDLLK